MRPVRKNTAMPRYILLLHESAIPAEGISPEEMQSIIQRYKSWSDTLRTAGHLLGGEKLQDGFGRMVRRDEGKVIASDGPYTESKEIVSGFFMLRADSYDHAQTLIADCPHLDFGAIELREIDELEGH